MLGVVVVVDWCRMGRGITMSVLTIIGWGLVMVGAVLLIVTVVRARRSEPLPPIAPDPLSGEDLSVRQRMQIDKRARGRGAVPPGQARLVRAQAKHLVEHPLTHELGFVAVGLIFLGVGVLTWTPVSGSLFVLVGMGMVVLPLTMRRRLRRSQRVLEELPPA